MNRINQLFANQPKNLLSIYFCAGAPRLEGTADVIRTLAKNGISMLEVGIPFSDPMADGPVIQEASTKALRNGMSLNTLFDQLKDIRQDVNIPLILMGYLNPIIHFGFERFCQKCVEVGIDGMILPDVPFEEKEEFTPACRARGLSFISLIAPTSEKRIAMIAREAEGFLYIVSSMGVTGVRSEITTDIGAMVKVAREHTNIPCAVGFGISTPVQAKRMADLSDGAIVGSAIVRLIAEHGKDAPEYVYEYVKSMKKGMGA